MKLSQIHVNPGNPRLIKDDRFKKLVKSIKEFPKMMVLRPIIIDDEGMILGGNMRFKALKELGYKEVPDDWVKLASELTDEEKRRFIVEDNVPFVEWDWNALANEWDEKQLIDWGVEMPFYDPFIANKINEMDEYLGMPAFEAGRASEPLIIHFETPEEREEFVKKHKIRIGEQGAKYWSTWYPFKEKEDRNSLKYEPDASTTGK